MNYSVVIRTVGTAGEKYRRTLDSIDKQTIKPQEVLVVLPEGYPLPPERLGYEAFVYSKKGMVSQRIFGGEQAKGEYILFLDDDVAFEEDFVEKLYAPIEAGLGDVTVPPILDILPPKRGIRKIIPMISLSACPTVFHRNDMYTKILKSGGWSYNHYAGRSVPRYLRAETAAGACFFCKKADFLQMHYEEELWLQDVRYPLWEDQVMFYKMHLSGKRILCVTDVSFAHLDAGGSSPDRAKLATQAGARNKAVFWYKFIYKKQQNILGRASARLMYGYSVLVSSCIHGLHALALPAKREEFCAYRAGLKDGKAYIREKLK